jgi:poly(A) polymerase
MLTGYFSQSLGEPRRATLVKLAALLHDVGKPATKTIEPGGRMRFFGHPELGGRMVAERLTALRFSGAEVAAVRTMVEQHMRPAQWRDSGPPTQRALYKFFRDLGTVAVDTIVLNLADHVGARGPALSRSDWDAHVAWAEQVIAWHYDQERRVAPPRPVTGHDLMETFGLQPGPLLGELLAGVDEARATGAVVTREDALRLVARRLRGEERTPAVAG